MRITRSSPTILQTATPHQLSFTGDNGELFRVTALEHDLIRVQHLPDGQPRLNRTWAVVGPEGEAPRKGRPREDLTPFSLPVTTHQTHESSVTLQTDLLRLSIQLQDFSIAWQTATGRTFASDTARRAYPYDRTGRTVFHYMQRRLDEHYYGFGEKSGLLDKQGRRLRMQSLDAMGYDAKSSDPLYKHWPFYITFVPELGIAYGIFYDNAATCRFDLGQEIDAYHGYYRYYQADDGDIDYYFIYGPTIEQVVEKFTALTGRMALPPRWSLGFLGSTMLYTELPDADSQLRQFADLCQQHDIPCDMFQLSSGYTSGGDDGYRYVFNWNRSKFPDPAAMVIHFHQAGIRLSANIKPYLLTTHPRYEEVASFGGFIQAAAYDAPELATLWSGGAFASAQGAYLDFTNPATYQWWQEQVKAALLDYGIDSTWNDNNEYEIWDDEAQCHGFGHAVHLGLLRPLQGLLMVRASYEAQRDAKPNERPFVLTRSGSPGIQRYAQTWSGDNATSWETLRYNIPMGLGMGLSGMANVGHDVGGFFGPKPSPELFLRWVQHGILQPRFTIHSFNTDGSVNEPWMYPEILPMVREAIQFRYRLMPYLYSLFVEAARTGDPITRPLVYAFPHDPQCYTESFDFMLGPHLLVAAVLEEGARTREVYLPMGTDWYDFYSGQCYAGGQTIAADAPLEHIPLFVAAGGMIPMGKVMRYVGQQPDDLRRVYVFPHQDNGSGQFILVEDDGISMNYQRGDFAEVMLEVVAEPELVTLRASVEGNYPLPYRSIEFILPPNKSRSIRASGAVHRDEQGQKRVRVVV